jgi:7,8-dihydro-6-hydroxymethylpterin-pyrophosphokinase
MMNAQRPGAVARDAWRHVGDSPETLSEPHVVVPEWMTPQQVEAISNLYTRNPDGSVNQAHFFNRVHPHVGGYCGLDWCGMFVGIEKDGYTHT